LLVKAAFGNCPYLRGWRKDAGMHSGDYPTWPKYDLITDLGVVADFVG